MFLVSRKIGLPLLILAGLAFVAGLALALWGVYSLSYTGALRSVSEDVETRARLRAAVLQSEMERQATVALVLSDDSDVTAALLGNRPALYNGVSKKLDRLRTQTRSSVIYIIQASGQTVAASNWALPVSFVGSNYSFRPYFREAMTNGTATQFALGTVSRKPGLFFARAVTDSGRRLGVVVVKMEFDPIEATWSGLDEDTYVTGPTGEVFLTALPERRFKPLPALTDRQIDTVIDLPGLGWKLHIISSDQAARDSAIAATLTAALGFGLLWTLSAWQWRRLRQRRLSAAREAEYRERLERDVATRTEALSATNDRLSKEIRERRNAQRRLSRLQADLVQANKLASLGQITAGVAHEINQPVATIRVLAETAASQAPSARGAKALIAENLSAIIRMCDRLGHITGELRTFSRKASSEVEPVPLKEAVDSSILLNESRLRDHRVTLRCDPIDPQLRVMASRVRLEQVLVNLLQNAFEALEGLPDAKVRLSLSADGNQVHLRVADNGPGLPPPVLAQLFTPFVTTKPKGLGLGLVIAHDILRDFGGALSAESSETGATFTLTLCKAT
ncbi:sensor histidine kinase [Asticcacaulis excentricus]|uniref:histidine kinase n=1 Tax=Asticcacaulis excentricus (strain ATCC 15261 / DSM 4724 / KCTC 12464 / NCIMB 9791 / VKM B-1370 / CB 48) TaxID=573065 RepID=E8RU68_ASTEC|nr:ATP-binding protein [Asticcacaulis excentricus]ADU15039.1 integral membrane sensor signal transduction histidine kinase [Asticcacaulis excentricus CB 48]